MCAGSTHLSNECRAWWCTPDALSRTGGFDNEEESDELSEEDEDEDEMDVEDGEDDDGDGEGDDDGDGDGDDGLEDLDWT